MNTDNRPNLLDDNEMKRIQNMDPKELFIEASQAQERHSQLLDAARDETTRDYNFENAAKSEIANGRSASELMQESNRLMDFVEAADKQLDALADKNRRNAVRDLELANPTNFVPSLIGSGSADDVFAASGEMGRIIAAGGVTEGGNGSKIAGHEVLDFLRTAPQGANLAMNYGGLSQVLNTSTTTNMPVDHPLSRQGVTMLHDEITGVADRIPRLAITYGDRYTFRQESSSSQTIPNSFNVSVTEGGAPQEQTINTTNKYADAEKLGLFMTFTKELMRDNIGWMQWMNQRIRRNFKQIIEYSVVKGPGTGGQWTGLLGQTVTNAVARPAAGQKYTGLLDHIRHNGKFKMYKDIGLMPSFMAMSSDVLDELLDEKDGEQRHYLPISVRSGEIPRLWGTEIVVSNHVPDHKIMMVYAPDVAIVMKQGLEFDIGLNGDDLKNGTRTVVVTMRGNTIQIRPDSILRLDTRIGSAGDA